MSQIQYRAKAGLVFLAAVLPAVLAQGGATCNVTHHCSSSAAPCCSEFGFCGTDTFCLGGCNPLASLALDSCMPNPVCKNAVYTFPDLSSILMNSTYYDGNATEYDWVLDKGNIINTNSSGGELAMLLTEKNGGTRLSSTRYLHYGKISAKLKTGRWGGVVTAFITMSDIKDEIDWEFPGNATTEAQTNYFWQGVIPEKTVGTTVTGLTDTYSNYHTYTFDWQPDTLTWLIDNNIVRTLQRTDTIDSAGVAHYPSTPSRIQLSIWPAGINTSAAGTVEWAGGMINWQDPDYISSRHFYAVVQSVEVDCGDPTKPSQNVTSYVYGQNTTLNTPSVAFSNRSTINGATGGFGGISGGWTMSTVLGATVVSLLGAMLA